MTLAYIWTDGILNALGFRRTAYVKATAMQLVEGGAVKLTPQGAGGNQTLNRRTFAAVQRVLDDREDKYLAHEFQQAIDARGKIDVYYQGGLLIELMRLIAVQDQAPHRNEGPCDPSQGRYCSFMRKALIESAYLGHGPVLANIWRGGPGISIEWLMGGTHHHMSVCCFCGGKV